MTNQQRMKTKNQKSWEKELGIILWDMALREGLPIKAVERKIIKLFYQELIRELEGVGIDLVESGNGNFYINQQNVTMEEYERAKRFNAKIDQKIDQLKKGGK